VNLKPFFVDALTSALDLGIATPDDVLRHVTPDLLANHLPRPLWARLLTACVGASRVDAQLVVETLGVSNLCEHIPATAIWSCLAEVAQRSLGGEVSARPAAAAAPAIVTRPQAAKPNAPLSISGPPPPDPVKPTPAAPPPMAGPSIPSPGTSPANGELAGDNELPSRSRTATGGRFRQNSTNIGRLAANNQRRPQAAAQTPPPPSNAIDPATERPTRTNIVRRGETEVEVEIDELEAGGSDWRSTLAVEDEQLVDWSASEETLTSTGDDPAFRNKR
jgi:hypothetical protein